MFFVEIKSIVNFQTKKKMLKFESKEHTYRWNDKIVPSVTQIIGSYKKVTIAGRNYYINTFTGTPINADKMDYAADFGTAVHLGAKYILKMGIDWDTLDSALTGSLKQFEQWIEDWEVSPLLVEEVLYSKKYQYAGTLDLVCEAKQNKRKVRLIIDFKTGNYNMAGPQLAAYEQLYKENSKYRGKLLRYVLYLPKDGSLYKFIPQDYRHDWGFFQSRMFQHKFLSK